MNSCEFEVKAKTIIDLLLFCGPLVSKFGKKLKKPTIAPTASRA
jgi:hypothetical protein